MDIQKFKDLLKSRNLKATKNRLNLLAELQNYKSAMPFSIIQKKLDYIDRVTLYRTIETLSLQGLIHKAYQENNETFYAICGRKCSQINHNHEHIHFKCVSCNTVTCKKIEESFQIKLPHHEIQNISINVQGLCQSCVVEQ